MRIKLLDSILLAVIGWRVARLKDAGVSVFLDRLAHLILTEVRRRNMQLDGWDAAREGARDAAARERAMKEFSSGDAGRRIN